MKSGRKIFWGLLLLAIAVLLITGNFLDLPVLDVLVLLVLAAVLAEGIIHRNFALILFPIAVAVILNSERLGIGEINAWSVLAAALLGSIGLSVLFPRKGRPYVKNGNFIKSTFNFIGNNRNFEEAVQNESEETLQDELKGDSIRLENTFSDTVKYITSMALSDVNVTNCFGNMTIYFNNAVLKNHTAYARIVTSFGNTVLYVPASWKVVTKGHNAFGSIKEKGQSDPNSKEFFEIRAEASFGNVEIRYI